MHLRRNILSTSEQISFRLYLLSPKCHKWLSQRDVLIQQLKVATRRGQRRFRAFRVLRCLCREAPPTPNEGETLAKWGFVTCHLS